MRKEIIGDAVLYCGDCLEIMPTLGKVDAVIADPPYGTTACKWDSVIPFDEMWNKLNNISSDNTPIVLTSSQPFTSALINSNMEMFKYEWIWDKKTATGGALASTRPMKSHENICVFYKSQPTYNRQWIDFTDDEIARMRKHDFVCKNAESIGKGTNVSTGWFDGKMKNPKSVININGVAPCSDEKQQGGHPTQKPVALMKYLINTYTNEGDIVIDFSMGTVTTGVAAVQEGRKFIGIEIDEKYFDIACKRIEEAQKQLRLFA